MVRLESEEIMHKIEIAVLSYPEKQKHELVVRCPDSGFELSTVVDNDPDAARFVASCVSTILAQLGGN